VLPTAVAERRCTICVVLATLNYFYSTSHITESCTTYFSDQPPPVWLYRSTPSPCIEGYPHPHPRPLVLLSPLLDVRDQRNAPTCQSAQRYYPCSPHLLLTPFVVLEIIAGAINTCGRNTEVRAHACACVFRPPRVHVQGSTQNG
jgi:hypothetical protein